MSTQQQWNLCFTSGGSLPSRQALNPLFTTTGVTLVILHALFRTPARFTWISWTEMTHLCKIPGVFQMKVAALFKSHPQSGLNVSVASGFFRTNSRNSCISNRNASALDLVKKLVSSLLCSFWRGRLYSWLIPTNGSWKADEESHFHTQTRTRQNPVFSAVSISPSSDGAWSQI